MIVIGIVVAISVASTVFSGAMRHNYEPPQFLANNPFG